MSNPNELQFTTQCKTNEPPMVSTDKLIYDTTYQWIFERMGIPLFDLKALIYKVKDVVKVLYESNYKNGIIRCNRLLDYYNSVENSKLVQEAREYIEELKQEFIHRLNNEVLDDNKLVEVIDKKVIDEYNWWSKHNYCDMLLPDLESRLIFLLLTHIPYSKHLKDVVIFEKLPMLLQYSTPADNVLQGNKLRFEKGFSVDIHTEYILNDEEMELIEIIQDKRTNIESQYLFLKPDELPFTSCEEFETFVCRSFNIENIEQLLRYQRLKKLGLSIEPILQEADIGTAPMEHIEVQRLNLPYNQAPTYEF